jgi:hypothetical protein
MCDALPQALRQTAKLSINLIQIDETRHACHSKAIAPAITPTRPSRLLACLEGASPVAAFVLVGFGAMEDNVLFEPVGAT